MLESRYGQLLKMAAEHKETSLDLLERAAKIDAINQAVGPEPDDRTVVVFTKTFNKRERAGEYTYAAIRIHERWYITQSSMYEGDSPMTWEELIEFAGLFDERCIEFLFASEWSSI